MIKGIDHVTIVVSDLDASIKFYTETLGLRRAGGAHLQGEWTKAVLGLEGVVADVSYLVSPEVGTRLELLCFEQPQSEASPVNSIPSTIGVRHIAFRVEAMDGMVKHLREMGVKFLGDGVSLPADVESGGSGQKTLCYFLDPDGVLLELAEYR